MDKENKAKRPSNPKFKLPTGWVYVNYHYNMAQLQLLTGPVVCPANGCHQQQTTTGWVYQLQSTISHLSTQSTINEMVLVENFRKEPPLLREDYRYLLSFSEVLEKFQETLQNYTSIGPKQQQTMFPRRSCATKNALGAPFLRKETKEKKGDKPRNPSPEPEGARKSRWNPILFPEKRKEINPAVQPNSNKVKK